MKKIFALFLCCLMLLSFVACGKNNGENAGSVSGNSNSSDIANNKGSDNSNSSGDSGNEAVPQKPAIRISAAPELSEILSYITPEFVKQTGYSIEADFASVGVVLGKAKMGEADLVIVNSKSHEEKFIEDGYASTQRLSCMYNYFVICGPKNDPAGVSQAKTAAEAFAAIAESGSPFISIGDNSIPHIQETSIWESANFDPRIESWYTCVQSNESDALTQANKNGAYVLAQKTTYLSMKNSLKKLEILKDDGDDLKNTYSMIAVNAKAAAFADSGIEFNAKGAKAFIKWIQSDEAVKLFEEFSNNTFGESLFFADQAE